MCRFFSALVLRNGDLLHDPATDHHSWLIEAHGLNAFETSRTEHFVRVEYAPNNPELSYDLSAYRLRVDEETTPIWWDEVQESVEAKCRAIVSRMIINDARPMLLSGAYVLGPKAAINQVVGARIAAMCGDAYITKTANTHIESMFERARIFELAYGSVVGTMFSDSQISWVQQGALVDTVVDRSRIGTVRGHVKQLSGAAAIDVVESRGLVDYVVGDARIQHVGDRGIVDALGGAARIGTVQPGGLVTYATGRSVIAHLTPGAIVRRLAGEAVVQNAYADSVILTDVRDKKLPHVLVKEAPAS